MQDVTTQDQHTQDSIHSPDRTIHRWESFGVALVSLTLCTWLANQLGVWEPWEAQFAEVLTHMYEQKTWLQVNLPQSVDQVRYIPQLPFSYWPSMWLYQYLPNELGLRLVNMLLAAAVSISLFHVSAKIWGRKVAYLASVLWLSFPAVSLSTHFAIYDAGAWYWNALACLAFLHARMSTVNLYQRVLMWTLWLIACCSGGLIAGLIPLLILVYPLPQEPTTPIRTHLGPALMAMLVLGLAIWRVQIKTPETVSWLDLWLLPQPLQAAIAPKEYQGFQHSIHMLGFGLFPISALLPMILVYVIQQKEVVSKLLVSWFAIAFLIPAIMVAHGTYMTPLLALPVAIAGAVYLVNIPYLPAQNLWVFISILFLLLLDSNLNKAPHLLVETLLSHSIEDAKGWPALWGKARLVTIAFMTFLLMYQSTLCSRILQIIHHLWHHPKAARYNIYVMALGLVVGLAVWIPQVSPAISDWHVTRTFLTLNFWGRIAVWTRLFIWVVLVATASMLLVWTLWGYHFQRKQRQTAQKKLSIILSFFISLAFVIPHYLPSLPAWVFIRPLLTSLENFTPLGHVLSIITLHVLLWGVSFMVIHRRAINAPQEYVLDGLFNRCINWGHSILKPEYALILCVMVCLGFTINQHHKMPQKFTQQLSQKSLIQKFENLRQDDEPLSLYQLNHIQHAFYLKDKSKLEYQSFEQAVKQQQRHFILIDRKRLSDVNRHFRKLTQKNIPVLDNSSHRFLLVSNQLKDHEKDLNPIKQALLKELPKNVTQLPEAINFEDRIELVGWALNPAQPRPGATLDLKLYWRCKKRTYGTWKIFVHIDSQGQRIHADHDPVEGLFPTKDWNEGDLIQDIHTIKVKSSIKPASFIFYTGLYQGKRRMKIQNKSPKLKDKENRAIVGKVVVRSR